ncbi:MAG: Holliday junction branch migration protein RuvA [Patescibacteria group bacterium]|jgi:Holliday junction DNA helicase RuvA|nr:Holliday junction branch migration protein RuvA [Patescibacteria group bacterium]
MIYFIEGEIVFVSSRFVVIKSGGMAFKVFVHPETIINLSDQQKNIRLYVYLNVKEDALELYGFLTQEELEFFELLNSVAGVGPKSALALIGIGSIQNLKAAILSNKIEFLTKAPGIGRKTAERIILELKSKLSKEEGIVETLESDLELENALVDLGYHKEQIRKALKEITDKNAPFSERLKQALKILANKK